MAAVQKKYTDLNLTFAAHPVSGKLSVLSDAEAVKRAIRNLLLTDRYEVPYDPLYGSGIRKKLFENFNNFTAHSLKKDIETTIRNYDRRVKIEKISIAADEDNHGIDILIRFQILNRLEPVELSLFLERTR